MTKMCGPSPREIYSHLKSSAKKRNIPFELTVYDIYCIDYPLVCPILQIPLAWHTGAPQDNSYSFDRLDSSKGYSFTNLAVISFKANRAKNNLSEAELKLFSKFYACY